jgi:predicted phage baseplate assembly protein
VSTEHFDSELCTCGCCEGTEPLTPGSVENRPGLSELAWRAGTHGRFKQTMLAALTRSPALRDLTTREDDDPTVALADGWATVLDILSFYQERIANEGYLRTATERRSILELARAIGYELNPGVAASTWLAFTLETAPGSPPSAVIGAGARAQSIPKQDELPQVFETVETIEARAAWNALRVRSREMRFPREGEKVLYLRGLGLQLKAGDALAVVNQERALDPTKGEWHLRRAAQVEEVRPDDPLDADKAYTLVHLDEELGALGAANQEPRVFALRLRASAFGHNAPQWKTLPKSLKQAVLGLGDNDPIPATATEWPDFTLSKISGKSTEILLDAVYPQILAGSWVVLTAPGLAQLYRVKSTSEDGVAKFTLSAKTTRLELEGLNLAKFDELVRQTGVFAHSERLALAERPIDSPLAGAQIALEAPVPGMEPGRALAVSGIDDLTGLPAAEVALLQRLDAPDRLLLAAALQRHYRRETVRINANVARATHGETRAEVLGSGDGSRRFQRFELKQRPLTYVAAPTASGARTTLEVRVDGIRWDEVPSLYQAAPDARVYITRLDDDGRVTVQFGDGVHGARLPTGQENVRATYRTGTGFAGLLDAGQISLLLTRPLGVQGVTNPEPPSGAADPEVLAGARRNAPRTVLTLERVVSLRDFEDFARTFGGIGKAQATWLWDGERRLVHLTVAAADGGPAGAGLVEGLTAAIDAGRTPDQPLRIDSYALRPFGLKARLKIDPRRISAEVSAAAREALLRAFSFEARDFGQAVTASEVIAVLQGAGGVTGVVLDTLGGLPGVPPPRLPSQVAHWSGLQIQPAELRIVDPVQIELLEETP